MQLTEQYRPKKFEDMVGQKHLVGTNGMLTKMLERKQIHSSIFYGPPGTGKTTAAMILATQSNMKFAILNATNASLADVRKIADASKNNTTLLYLDEIQYFNKKQQQSLLPYLESGQIVLIAATTDNPYYCCYDALLSRCIVMEFKPIANNDLFQHISNLCQTPDFQTSYHVTFTSNAIKTITENASGDVRRATHLLEAALLQYDNPDKTQKPYCITENDIKTLLPSIRMCSFDKDGDDHYSLISGLQKSIRGSDPNAAVFYLARLLEGGDILSPCRRLMVIANEDIGLAYPDAIPFTYSCIEMAKQLGMPEAAKPLTNAVILLAIAPKSSTAENTYNPAADDIKNGFGQIIPTYLRHACSKGYKYPHDYPNHWVPQQYMPDDLKDRVYYTPGDNSFEQGMANYWRQVHDIYFNTERNK